MFNNIGSFYHCACIAYRDMKHFESPESIQIKSQNDRPSPQIPHESRANSRGTREFVTFKGGAVCCKNSTFGYFDGTARTPCLGSAPTPIIAPDIDRETFEKPPTACLVPRRLSLDENVRAKEGGKETTGVCTLPMVPCSSSPVTRVSRSPLRWEKRSAWGGGCPTAVCG